MLDFVFVLSFNETKNVIICMIFSRWLSYWKKLIETDVDIFSRTQILNFFVCF